MRPNGLQLQRLAKLAVTGQLQVRIAKEYPFEEIQAACDYVATGHADGKVIIKLTDWEQIFADYHERVYY